jgi:hypothetical protein
MWPVLLTVSYPGLTPEPIMAHTELSSPLTDHGEKSLSDRNIMKHV